MPAARHSLGRAGAAGAAGGAARWSWAMERCYMGAARKRARAAALGVSSSYRFPSPKTSGGPMHSLLILAAIVAVFVVLLGVAPLRRQIVSRFVLRWYRGQLPAMSQTEREAIDAGTVWWDGDLFSGRPDWNKLLSVPRPSLSPEEQSFLDNETDQLCAMLNDWETT